MFCMRAIRLCVCDLLNFFEIFGQCLSFISDIWFCLHWQLSDYNLFELVAHLTQ
ncbi:unnamed protein product, partial [Vitis vinifera]